MGTMQEQLQQVKQQMGQQNEQAPAGKPCKPENTDISPDATRATQRGAGFNPWKVSAKHLKAPHRPEGERKAAEPGITDGQRRHKAGNRKKIRKLVDHWPNGFSLDSVRPLSIGIQDALIADAEARALPITLSQIRYCLSAYTKRPAYLKALAAGGTRYDQNGQPCGEVSAEHQREAADRLAEIKRRT